LALGRTVAELEARISEAELTEWMGFYLLEPWGCEVEDWRAAMIAATTRNVFRGPKDRPSEPKDFMPKRGPLVVREQTIEEQEAILRMFERLLGSGGTTK